MNEEEEWNALCLSCGEENMRHITDLYPRDHLYQCPNCRDVKKVIFGHRREVLDRMESIGVKTVYKGK